MKSRGHVIVPILVLLIGAGVLVTALVGYNRYSQRQKALSYQRNEQARIAAEAKAKADARIMAEAEAREQAERDRLAEEKEKLREEAKAKAAAAAEARAEAMRAARAENGAKRASEAGFDEMERSFLNARAKVLKSYKLGSEKIWGVIPDDNGMGRLFEVIPGDDGAQVRCAGENGLEQMTFELFKLKYLQDFGYIVLKDGVACLVAGKLPEKKEKLPVPTEARSEVDLGEIDLGKELMAALKTYHMKPEGLEWDVAFVTKGGATLPCGQVKLGEKVTRALFVPAVKKALVAAAAKKDAERMRQFKSAVFKPLKKRTHFLYDKNKILRTVDGCTYVPRHQPPDARSGGKRSGTLDSSQLSAHETDWSALYQEARRQEKAEAKERAEWEKSRKTPPKPTVVTDEMVGQAMDLGWMVYSVRK